MSWITQGQMPETIKNDMFNFWDEKAPKTPKCDVDAWHGSLTLCTQTDRWQSPIERYDENGAIETIGMAYLTKSGDYSESV